MINQDLIDRFEAHVDAACDNALDIGLSGHDNSVLMVLADDMAEMLDSYKKLVESNAELHKELAKLRGENE